MTAEEPEWVNLTDAIYNSLPGVDWWAFGQRDWPIRLTRKHYTGALEATITPDGSFEPKSHHFPWDYEFWKLAGFGDEGCWDEWDMLYEAWTGQYDWTLWVKGPLPMKEN